MTSMSRRPIVTIDESRCNGCGLCITACAEGALQLVNGKAKLVSEIYCDGLGACLGECPQGAITVTEREAAPFDEAAVAAHLATLNQPRHPVALNHTQHAAAARSALANWPVQLSLLPVNAPYLRQATLLLAADCVPFAVADFHQRFLSGKVLAVGCPKLDDVQFYLNKLTQMISSNDIAAIHVVYMEVPCCAGLVRLAQMALARAGKDIPFTHTRISINGEVLETACA